MNSLLTEIYKCVGHADKVGEEIKILLHPHTIDALCCECDKILAKPIDRSKATLYGKPVVADDSIVENSFWIERVTE